MASRKNRKTHRKPARAEAAKLVEPVLGREEFAKISEVEGFRLSDDMKQAMAEFDRQGLSHAERRRAIIGRFKRTDKQS